MKRTLLFILSFFLIAACAKESQRLVLPKIKRAIDYGSLPPPALVADAKLWPPDGRLFTFTVEDMKAGLSDDYVGDLNTASIEILFVSSDEAEDAPGTQDGNTLNDIVIGADCQSIQVRRERMGGGNGRVYRVAVTIIGDAGTVQADYIVAVPKWAWGWNSEAVEDAGQGYSVTKDGDGDGYSCGDCDDSDPNVNPGATEICDNGLDDDCDGDVDEADSDCPSCSTDGLLEVTVNTGSEIYTLYVHPEDQRTGFPASNGVQWGGFGTDIPGLDNKTLTAAALADFDGAANTQAIVGQLGAGDYAAKVCADLEYNGCDDWYLPALGELKAMYDQLGGTGNNNFTGYYYWSSTEFDANFAWIQYFDFGSQNFAGKNFDYTSCRCARR